MNNKVLRIIINVMLIAIVAALLLTSLVPLMH
ncbi:stressosome-associated protein Prli42 [Staphylococcus haemolyticus]|nr:stressosome-associated protein Prli42 [Staphylococcus haemolyticus]